MTFDRINSVIKGGLVLFPWKHFNATEITISYKVGIDDVFNKGEGEDK